MVAAPEPSDIQNVFAMHEPHHMLAKLLWEIDELTTSMSVWVENGQFPVPIFRAFNTAVTAWHITDWIWQSNKDTRDRLRKRYDVFDDETKKGLRKGLGVFQDKIAKDCRDLYICREIANGSKHMRTEKRDDAVRATAKWSAVVEGVGLVKPGDLVMSLRIADRNQETNAEIRFIEAFGYWEKLFTEERLLHGKTRLSEKIIKTTVSVPVKQT